MCDFLKVIKYHDVEKKVNFSFWGDRLMFSHHKPQL